MKEKLNSTDICCLIITFNPEHQILDLIELIRDQVGIIIIVDNNSEKNAFDIIRKIIDNKKIFLLSNSQNLGIAKALNQGISLAKEMQYKWAITFDQDTLPYKNIIETISEVFSLYPNKELIGAIGVNYLKSNSFSYYKVPSDKLFVEKDYLITSGCLLSIETYSEVGGFREDFFIDNVDIEYSLRLRKNGKACIITQKYGMNHKVGAPKSIVIIGFKLISSNHNSIRRYFKARNHIILTKEYLFRFPYFIAKSNYFFFLSLIHILLIDDRKKEKIFATIRGIKDGIQYSSKNKKLI